MPIFEIYSKRQSKRREVDIEFFKYGILPSSLRDQIIHILILWEIQIIFLGMNACVKLTEIFRTNYVVSMESLAFR